MKLLVDTHYLLWAAVNSPKLPGWASLLLTDPANEIFFSTVSIWEVAIKFAQGRADFVLPPRTLCTALLEIGFTELLLTSEQVFALLPLPSLHRDPFDRLLLAQAIAEGLTLLTADRRLLKYPGPIYKS